MCIRVWWGVGWGGRREVERFYTELYIYGGVGLGVTLSWYHLRKDYIVKQTELYFVLE